MAENELIKQNWIVTPFAYTRLSKNLTLLQQAMLVKVVERLQPFIKDFFNDKKLSEAQESPKALFSEAIKNAGITQFNISYADLGVSVNNYYAAKKAIEEVLNLKVYAPGYKTDEKGEIVKDPNGNPIPSIRTYNVFSYSEVTKNSNDRVLFNLNLEFLDPILEYKDKRVVDYVFDMNQNYIYQPDNIALVGEVERMPMIYYLLRRNSGHKWKNKEFHLSVTDIKEYLGMIEYADGQIIKEAYPKFSQFRKNVLDTSIADINRLCKEGLLDVCVSYEPIYNGKRKVGNPYRIKFCIFDSIDDMNAASRVGEPSLSFAEQKPGEAEWQTFLTSYNGSLHDILTAMPFSRTTDTAVILHATPSQEQSFNTSVSSDLTEARNILAALAKAYGRRMTIKFI